MFVDPRLFSTYLGVPNKQNELHILRIYRWWGWHLWSHLLSTHALSHALFAFAFCRTCLQCKIVRLTPYILMPTDMGA